MLDRTKRYMCPCCGGTVDKPLGNKQRPLFGPLQQALFNIIKNCPEGISVAALHERVYGESDRCQKLIPTHVFFINKKLKQWGLQIKSTGGPGSHYFLIQI